MWEKTPLSLDGNFLTGDIVRRWRELFEDLLNPEDVPHKKRQGWRTLGSLCPFPCPKIKSFEVARYW